MHIVCPHCTTSYEVDPANFPDTGRRVRCARCQEIWLAMPQELVPASATKQLAEEAAWSAGLNGDSRPSDDWQDELPPHVESPSISAGWPQSDTVDATDESGPLWSSLARQDAGADAGPVKLSPLKRLRNFFGKRTSKSTAVPPKAVHVSRAASGGVTMPVVCMVLGTVVFALIAWRTDIVRAMPQTAAFFKMIGMGVNLRGLAFEDLKISTEIANNKPVLLIEGAIIDVARKSVEIPRLRFIVRDARGTDIYSWNAVLEQPVINPGEKAWFKTRLASPPAEGREIAVRFFHKLDIASGGA